MNRIPYVLSGIFVFAVIPATAIAVCAAVQGFPLALLCSALLIPTAAALWECLRTSWSEPWSERPGWSGVNLDL